MPSTPKDSRSPSEIFCELYDAGGLSSRDDLVLAAVEANDYVNKKLGQAVGVVALQSIRNEMLLAHHINQLSAMAQLRALEAVADVLLAQQGQIQVKLGRVGGLLGRAEDVVTSLEAALDHVQSGPVIISKPPDQG